MKRPPLLAVPHHRQPNSYTCVPVCIKMLLDYYGIRVPLHQIIAGCQTDKNGTDIECATEFLNSPRLDLHAVYHPSSTISQILRLVRRGYPVITDVRYKFLTPNKRLKNTNLHVVIVVGYNARRIYFLDPLKKKHPQSLTAGDFRRAHRGLGSIYIL